MALAHRTHLASTSDDAPGPAVGGDAAGSGPPLFDLVRELRARIDELELRIYRMEAKANPKEEADD